MLYGLAKCWSCLWQYFLFTILRCRGNRKMSRSEGILKDIAFSDYGIQPSSRTAHSRWCCLYIDWSRPLSLFGSQRESSNKDAYNYFLSQLHIRIEMTFGSLTNKWRILRTSLSFSLKKSVGILSAFSRLHNFCSLKDWLNQFSMSVMAIALVLFLYPATVKLMQIQRSHCRDTCWTVRISFIIVNLPWL